MWYAIAIAVAMLGMYFILAHKDKELSGREPHHIVRSSRDSIDRVVAAISRTLGRAAIKTAKTSTQVAKEICVGGGKICVKCCTVAIDRGTKGVKAVARAARVASRKIAHPSSRE